MDEYAIVTVISSATLDKTPENRLDLRTRKMVWGWQTTMELKTDRLIALLSVVATLIVGWVTIGATITTAQWGGVPPKSLLATYIGPSDPFSDLANDESRLAVQLSNGAEQVSNLRIVQASIENTGKTPILPSDMVEPLSIMVDGPWRIINIANLKTAKTSGIRLSWKRISDQQFQSEPSLINPGDRIVATVYLTWTDNSDVPDLKEAPTRSAARISNLAKIDYDPDPWQTFIDKTGPIIVTVSGWELPFLLSTFFIYNALTVALVLEISLSWFVDVTRILLISAVGLLNLSGAEAGTTLLFGDYLSGGPPDLRINLPPFLLNATLILALWWMGMRKKSPRHLAKLRNMNADD